MITDALRDDVARTCERIRRIFDAQFFVFVIGFTNLAASRSDRRVA
jgi:hypothetical protein